MASGIVCSCISDFLDEEEVSSRTENGKKWVETLLQKIIGGDTYVDIFDEFSKELVSSLKKIFNLVKEYKSTNTKKEKLWCKFHRNRMQVMPDIWKRFCRAVDIYYNQLVAQTANMKLFEAQLTAFFANDSATEHMDTATRPSLKPASSSTTFSDDELNTMRQIAGYVPYSLLKKYERSHQVQTSTIECLRNMAVAGDDDIH